LLGLLCVVTVLAIVATPVKSSEILMEKIDPMVLSQATGGESEVLVFLSEQADLSPARQLRTKEEKGAFVYHALKEVALRTQKPLLTYLNANNIPYHSFWIANMVWVKTDYAGIIALAERNEVTKIYPNPQIQFETPILPEEDNLMPSSPSAVEWNIQKIHAPEVWAKGFTGQGAVIGGQDTGVDWEHEALKNQYRGWNGTSASHDYNWHDAIHNSSGNPCGNDAPAPCDDHGHGTHTIGIAVGYTQSKHIGVAPGAHWIACRNMDNGTGSPATYAECYQWFIAPYPVGGNPFTDGDPSKAPDILNNSWSCPTSEGCNPDSLRSAVQAVYAAGILSVHSAGNSGPSCHSIDTPAAIYPESFTVGATNSYDLIAGFSSRGPVTVSNRVWMKPNVSAPGSGIKSCIPDSNNHSSYGQMSGTSQAGPHVAGLAALLISADPSLSGQVDKLRHIIEISSKPVLTLEGCGGDTSTSHPNNTYGWGRVDALKALQYVDHHLSITKTARPAVTAPGQTITYTLDIRHRHPVSITTGVVVTDILPSQLTFIDATQPYSISGKTITWHLGSLTRTQTSRLQLIASVGVTVTGTVTNHYAIASNDVSRVDGNPLVTAIMPYTLTIEKKAPATVNITENLPFTITVTNTHQGEALHAVTISDTIPAGTTFVAATAPYTRTGNIIVWQKNTLARQKTWAVTLTVHVPVSCTKNWIINDKYGAYANEITYVQGNPSRTRVKKMDLTKQSTPMVTIPNKAFTYTLSVENTLPVTTIHNLVLTDTLPASVSFITATNPFTRANGIITWHKTELAAGANWTVTLRVSAADTGTIVNDDYGVKTNLIPAFSGEAVTTTIFAPALEISPGITIHTFSGAAITYTHILTNTGNFTDTFTLTITDTNSWLVHPAIPPVTLPSDGTALLAISVEVPDTASLGDTDTIRLTAQSVTDSTASGNVTDSLVVKVHYYFPFVSSSGYR